MGKKFFLMVPLILSFAVLFLSACDNGKDLKKINIAVMGSKEVYDLDNSFLNGVRMAVEDCNKESGETGKGFTVSYEFFDDNYDFEKGLLIANEIAKNPKYTAVLGSHSFGILDATTSLFEENDKILIAVNSMMDKSIVGKGYKNVFRNTAGEADLAKSLAIYAKTVGLHRLAICYSETEFEINVVKHFTLQARERGLEILSFFTPVGSERGFEKVIKTWDTLGIDGVFICRDAISDAFTLAKYIRNYSETIKIIGDFSFDADDKLKEYQQYVQGIVIPTLMPITQSEKLSAFEQRYFDSYGEKPTWWAAHGYDSVRMVVDSAVKAGTVDSEKIAERIHLPEGYKALTGTFVFDRDGTMMGENERYFEVLEGRLQFKSIGDFAERNGNTSE